MCHLSFSAGVVIPVSFEEVNRPPDAESGAECDDERLEGSDSAGEECHGEENQNYRFCLLHITDETKKVKRAVFCLPPLASYTVILDSFHSKNRFLFISPSVTLTNDKPYRLLAARRKYSTNSYRLFRERPLIGEWATCYEHAFLLYFLPFLRKIAVFITRLCETRCFLKCIRRRWNRMPDSAHHTHRLQKRHPA